MLARFALYVVSQWNDMSHIHNMNPQFTRFARLIAQQKPC